MRANSEARLDTAAGYCKYTSEQRDSIYHYLLLKAATIPMVSTDVGIPIESVLSCVQDLFVEGLLWTRKKREYRRTGRMGLFYTTNPEHSPSVQRLSKWRG